MTTERAYIPLSVPNFAGNERRYVDDAVSQGWVSTGGAYVTRLERALADFLRVENVAACQSGTAALHLSLVEAGVGPGDVVLVPPLTFIAAVNPVRYQFAEPVFIDCDDSLCLDPVKLAAFCEQECEWKAPHHTDEQHRLYYHGKPVKAVMVVHIFGNMVDMEAIMAIAERYNLTVIEDATEALGTSYTRGPYAGRFAGTIGHFGAYSFNGNKIITTGGGGAVTARDSKVTDHLRYLSTQAKDDPKRYIHHEVGYNYRMTNLQAALGVAQMELLPDFIRTKQRHHELYRREFAEFPLARLLSFRAGTSANMWLCGLDIDRGRVAAPLTEIIARLEDKGIQTRAVWGLINEQRPYRDAASWRLECAPHFADRVLNIPSGTQLTEEDIRHVACEIKTLLEGMAR